MTRRTALLLLPLLLPLAPVPAAAAEQPDVVVTAAVREADGGLAFLSRTADSEAEGEALAERWDAGSAAVVAAEVDSPVRATGVDPHRTAQWGLTRLAAETQWQGGNGSGAIVAVVDSGIDGAHPDLSGVLLPPIDLLEPGRTTSIDPNGHGTHVAGVIAARTGNDLGVAGLAPGARVLPVRVLAADGSGYDSTVAKGIVAAVDRGADVINLSLGGDSPSTVLKSAVSYATSKGVVVVAAMGNSGPTGPVEYPAAFPGVLAVTATDQSDAVASFSSRGLHADLAAPGVGILSTYRGGYQLMSGTSMAAPFVSAAAALLLSGGVPGGSVADRLTRGARDLGAAGLDNAFGYGLVDVARARALAATPTAPAPTAPAPTAPAPTAPAPVAVPGVRISASARVVAPRAPVSVSARALRDGVGTAGLGVRLERNTGRGWATVRTGTSGARGLISWTVRPDTGAVYRARVSTAVSAGLRIDVRQRLSAWPGRGTVSGSVVPSGRAVVALQRATRWGWVTVARSTSSSDGRYRLRASLRRGAVVRTVVASRPGLLSASSRSVRLG